MSYRERIAQVAQDKWVTVSESLRSLMTNERPWATHSGRLRQMSDRERIAQVSHDKWATVRDSLRSLMINEWMNDSLRKFWQKNLNSYFSVCFIYVFLFKKWAIQSFPLFDWCERINQIAHKKWATMSQSLRSLTKNERPWANRWGCSPKMSKWVNCSFFERIAHFWAKNERFARKTDERIPSPDSYISHFPVWMTLAPFYHLV